MSALATSPATTRLAERAARVRLVLTDCDGVLTDGGVYYSARGEVLKRFSMRDGMGVARLREAGIATGLVTGERCRSAARRAAKLGVPFVFLGVQDKASHIETILCEARLGLHQLAYIGDDVNDLGIVQSIGQQGLTAAPADAMPEVLASVLYRCTAPGGAGAFREFAEWILRIRQEAP